MLKRKKLIKWLAILAGVGVFMLAVAYVFAYDGFGLVSRYLDWESVIPENAQVDTSLEKMYTTITTDYLYIRVSQEKSPYLDIQGYIDHYFDRFIDSDLYRANNDIELLRHETVDKQHITTIRCNNMGEGLEDTYTYFTTLTGTRYLYRVIFKYDSGYKAEEAEAAINEFIENFSTKINKRSWNMDTDYEPVLPESWSEETRETYQRLMDTEQCWMGAFTADMSELEAEIGRDLPVVLEYIHLNSEFPMEEMLRYQEEGKLIELTLQYTISNNLDLYGESPLLGVLRGDYDEELREIAAMAKKFSHPFLFRLNNEMNSDWTSYSGIINLSDPELYKASWRYIYDLFEAEGVDNCIWIFNPNDNNFPPANWNDALAYYPGNEYVQVLGVTGYNTGNYYKDVTAESWHDFTEIYDKIEDVFLPHFEKFPWVITEFASSSYGGDKAEWIDDMYKYMSDYENIKVAVWFDYADFDFREGMEHIPARPYWIAETEETLDAFRRGLEGLPERFFE